MEKLLGFSPRPTAVFVASDVVALGAIRAIKQAGLNIPQDLAVVGFDDISLAYYYDPPLTTIHIPAYGLGWAVGERLVRLVQGEPSIKKACCSNPSWSSVSQAVKKYDCFANRIFTLVY